MTKLQSGNSVAAQHSKTEPGIPVVRVGHLVWAAGFEPSNRLKFRREKRDSDKGFGWPGATRNNFVAGSGFKRLLGSNPAARTK